MPTSPISPRHIDTPRPEPFVQLCGYRLPINNLNDVKTIREWSAQGVAGEDRKEAARKMIQVLHDRHHSLDLSNSQITSLPNKLPNTIKVLDVSNCVGLTRIEQNVLNNLESLNITGCTVLTNTEFPNKLVLIR